VSRPKSTLPYNPVADRMRTMITGAPANETESTQQVQRGNRRKGRNRPIYARRSRFPRSC
jgi:hypothetical protein